MAKSSSGEELARNLRDQFLQCKICLDGLKNPKTLPCLHTFCADCIVHYVDHNRLDNYRFSCPICRRHIYIPKNGIGGFPDSFFLQNLNDVLETSSKKTSTALCGICKFKHGSPKASASCLDCKIGLCNGCVRSHRESKITEGHTILEQGCNTRDTYCRIHKGETVKYYCETCNSPICLPCTFLDHKDHDIEEIKNVRRSFSEDMKQLVSKSKENIHQLESVRENLVELENDLFIKREFVKTHIRRIAQDLVASIHEQEMKLVSDVEAFFDIVAVAADRQKVEKAIFRLQRAHDFADQLLSSDTSPITQLVNRSEAIENLEQAQNYDMPDMADHERRLQESLCYLPGSTYPEVGHLLPCSTEGSRMKMTPRHSLPNTKTLFSYKLSFPQRCVPSEIVTLCVLRNESILTLHSEKKFVRIFSGRGRQQFEFGEDVDLIHPSDAVQTKDGDIAISDCGHQCVKVFDLLGTHKWSFGSEDTFVLPVSLTVDFIGRFLVCDQAKQNVTIHRPNGDLLQTINVQELASPQHICCRGSKLYLCDSVNNVIGVYTYAREGLNYVTKFSAEDSPDDFLNCSSIAVDKHGRLFIADALQNRIHLLNEDGEICSVIPVGKHFLKPFSLAVSASGIIAVAQEGVSLESDAPDQTEVNVYRLVDADF